MKRGMASVIVLGMLASALLPAVPGKELKRDPRTGMIRVLYIGAPFMTSPYQTLKVDPLLLPTPVDANQYAISLSWIKKAMRIYMPRTLESLTENYDVYGVDDASWAAFRAEWIHWMTEGCREHGMGAFMAGGFESFGGNAGFPSWGDTVLDQVMPVSCLRKYSNGASNIVTDFEDEFIRSLPWDDYNMHSVFCGYNLLATKQEAHELSHFQVSSRDPCWVWWDIGSGRFFASAGGFRGVSGWCQFYNWDHYPDFISNLQYFLAGLEPPDELELLHLTRQRFADVENQRVILSSTLDFIAKFDAETRSVDEKAQEALESLKMAKQHFVDLDLERSKELVDLSFDQFEDAYGLAIEAKNQAIFWVFVTEWLVVSATSMVVAFAVWTLMVRRRLYKEVRVTRGGRRLA